MIKAITFSDLDIYDYPIRPYGKALRDLEKFVAEHPTYKIISVFKRCRLIENAGNGTEYYDIDVIYEENYLGD